jgi:folate-binding protein YgfZ
MSATGPDGGRDVVHVRGPDAMTYLQGQLSQDVAGLPIGSAAPSFLLEPTGKVSAWLTVHRLADDGYALAVDAGFGSAVAERLARFKLRTKVEITTEAAAGSAAEGAPVDEEGRIAAGIPRMGAELVPGKTIPAEVGQALLDASVSFTKGCYTGQELVARIDSRGGHVPRQLRGVVVPGSTGPDDLPPVGATVEVDGVAVGELTSVAWSPARGAVIGLASVGRAVEPPADAVLRWAEGEAAAMIHILPLAGAVPSTA